MNQWTFVAAAYAVAIIATAGLLTIACLSMRRAEAKADELRNRE